MDMTGIVILLGMAGAVVLWFLYCARAFRRREWRIREWARENGYAVLDIRSDDGDDLEVLRRSFPAPTRHFRVRIQDDQGGLATVTIFLAKPSGPIDVRWG